MKLNQKKLLVISHAGVKRINRSVYALLKNEVAELNIIVPSKLTLKSEAVVLPDPRLPHEAHIIPMDLHGVNPRKYFYPALGAWLDDKRPDIILLENDPASNLGMRLAAWCRNNGSKIICQTYDNTPRALAATLKQQGIRAVPKNLLIHLLNYRMASKIEALLVVNQESADIFRQYGYRRIVKIPLGYDTSVFYPDENKRLAYRQKLGVSPETVLVAYFGRLVRQKGVHILIEALAHLKHLNWKLLLDHNHDNEDQYSSYIRDLIKRSGLEASVLYFDADHYEISNYMRASDIMVAPSTTTPTFKEQYGRVVQEAMACGCVCVVSDSGHPKDLVGEAALVFSEGDTAALKDLIMQLILDPGKRDRYRKSLAEKARTGLAVDRQAQDLRKLMAMI